MVGTSWRLTYNDSAGTKQTIAELGQDTGASKIDRIRYILNRKNPWILKVFADPTVLNNIPQEVSEFEASEPEILFEEYDNGWTIKGRFYNASETNEENEYAIQFVDYYHKIMNQEANVTSTTTNIVDVLEKALPSNYVVDAPAEVDVTGGYPSVDNYSCKNTQIRKVYREITRNNNWSLFFLPEQDGSGNWKVRFEPDGYGGTVNTLDTGTDPIKVKQWQPPRKRNLVTKTFVEGVNSSGTKITSTAENTAIRDKYLGTKAEDHNFRSYKVGYLESQAEADKIAENRLVPGPNATSVNDKIKISDTIYPQDVVNDSFGIIDQFRSIDDTFTCVKQENFYPANQSLLHFEFESEELEKAAEGEENLRDERARLYPSSATDEEVGNQDFTGDTGSAPSDTAQTGQVTDNQSDTNTVGGVTDNQSDTNAVGGVQQHTNAELITDGDTDTGSTSLNSNDWTFITNANLISNDSLFHQIFVIITDISSTTNLEIAIVQDDDFVVAHWTPDQVGNNNHDSLTGGTIGDDGYYANDTLVTPNNYGGSTVDYNLYIASKGSASPTVDATITANEIYHFHPDDIDTNDNLHPHGDDIDTNDNLHPHGDDFDTDDFNHGGTGDATGQHGTSGTTDPKSVTIDAAQEDKTDR